MRCVHAGARRGLRWLLWAVIAIIFLATAADDADARSRHRRGKAKYVYHPPAASLVVDANSGEVLHASNADNLRHPASLTKIMTLYLLFEEIERGRFNFKSELSISAEAASQAPSKLALRPGQTITVEEAIKALVTKSANDVAVVIAEAIGGDEETFAKLMTRKARALGMTRTVYRNASGLPDSEQVTTAKDQVALGRAIQDRFPNFYRFFSIMSFNYRGKAMRNHNRLLGRVDGMDGIKTGYTHSSGFNLVASVRRGHRHIVAAVFGGRSASARDAHMRTLIEQNINEGATRRTAAKILPSPSFGAASPGASFSQDTVSAQAAHIERVTAPTSILPTAGSLAPIQARRVKTLAVKPSTKQQAAVLIGGDPRAAVPPPPPQTTEQGSATSPASGSARHGSANAGTPNISLFSTNSPAPQAMALMSTAGPRSPAIRRGGWIIQIGAFDQESEARQRLKSALDTAKGMLANSDPFTEPVMKGEKTLYRARFAGFDRDRAQAACKLLKRNDFACLALKN